jgi:O-antigen ligase
MTSLFNWVVVLALVLAVPLIFSAKMDDSFNLPKLTLLYIGVIAFWAGWVINGLRQRKFVFRRSLLDLPLVAWLGVTLISSLLSIDPTMSFFGFHRLSMFGWFPMLAFAALFWAAVQVANRQMERVLAIGTVGVASLTAIYGLLQYYGYQIFPRMPDFTRMPILSTFGNPIFFGCYLMLVIPVAGGLFIETIESLSKIKPKPWKILLSLGGLSLLLFTFILTFARGPWVGLGVAAIFYITWLLKSQMRSFLGREFKKIILLVTESMFVMVLIIFLVYPTAQRRFCSIFDFKEPDICSRIEGWKAGFYSFLEHPIKGSGPDTFGYVFRRYKTVRFMERTGWDRIQMHAHNDFVQMATTTGTTGLLVYLWLWTTLLIKGWKHLEIRGEHNLATEGESDSFMLRGAWYASLLALFVQNQFNFSTVGTSAIAAIFAGMFFSSPNGDNRVKHSFSFSASVSSVLTGLVILATIVLCWFALRPARASLLYTKGLMNKSNGQWGYAIQDVQNALHLVPNNGAYRDELLRIYRLWVNDERDIERKRLLVRVAVAQARDNARRHPYDSCIHNNLGFILMWATLVTGDDHRTEAWASLRRAIELEPNFLPAWSNIAKLADSMGDRQRAISILGKILKIKPDHEEAKELIKKLR